MKLKDKHKSFLQVETGFLFFLVISNHDYLHTNQIEAIGDALKCFKIAGWFL